MSGYAHLAQIAFSVKDVSRSHDFYQHVLGFEPAGGTGSFRGPLTSEMFGLPEVAAVCWWMVDQREYMQLELFQFETPAVRPMPPDWRPCDIGYTSIGIQLVDFDALLVRLADSGTAPLTEVSGTAGSRRVCVRDPDGVLLEIMEDDPAPAARKRPELPAVARSITVSVPDLAKARQFWVNTLGLTEAEGIALHGPEHEALWALAGAERESLLLNADDFLIELVCYTQPLGRPWPRDYRITDQGILNVALGYRQFSDLRAAYERVTAAGYRCNRELLQLGEGGVVYCNDDQGFSVELLCSSGPAMDEAVGFEPRPQGTLTSSRRLGG